MINVLTLINYANLLSQMRRVRRQLDLVALKAELAKLYANGPELDGNDIFDENLL